MFIKLDDLEVIEKFLNKYDLTKPNQEEIKILNRLIMSKNIKSIIKSPKSKSNFMAF